MEINKILKAAENFGQDNASSILTTVGVVGTLSTAVLTGRAVLENHYILLDVGSTRKEKVEAVWRDFIPPVAVGSITISSIVFANRISSRKAAALAAAYSVSDRAFQEYKDKVVEHIGKPKEQKVRDEIAQDKVNSMPEAIREVIVAGAGEVLCMDAHSGRYFTSSIEKLRKAQNDINHGMLAHGYASLSEFYDHIGLSPTAVSDVVGWNLDNQIELMFSTTMTPDNRPCVVVDFETMPKENYNQQSWG